MLSAILILVLNCKLLVRVMSASLIYSKTVMPLVIRTSISLTLQL